jgi:mannose-1-phosphate guanylyltransferase
MLHPKDRPETGGRSPLPTHGAFFSAAGPGQVATAPLAQPAPVETTEADAALWAIVLAGGIGSRFWPLSSPQRPKQVLALVSERPLIAETVQRLAPLIAPERVLVLTSSDIAPGIRAAIPEVPPVNVIAEPRPSGTAAALAIGARELRRRGGPETMFCSIHADLAVGFPDAFRHVLREASRVAGRDDVLATIGVPASRPETGFGYIVPGLPLSIDRPLAAGGACAVQKYVEKPSAGRANELLRRGALWNSGIFVGRVRVVLDALAEHVHELGPALSALDEPEETRYAGPLRTVTIERGLLERCDRLVVVPGEFGWDDVGTWASLRRARELDDSGNGVYGPAQFVDASGNVVHSEGSTVVLYGVDGLLVVSLNGLTFVTTIERAGDLRPLLDALPAGMRAGGTIPPAL